jgi:hypothetical protein
VNASRWVALSGVLVFSCAKRLETGSSNGSVPAAAFCPLAVGNRWVYQANFLGEKTERTVQILREEDGFYLDNQGGALGVDATGIRDRKRYLLKEPVEPGRTWTNVVSVSSIERYKILDLGPCQVPAGRFESCVGVEGRNRVDDQTTLVNEMTLAQGVGIVKIETAAEVRGQRIPQSQLLLTRFELRPMPAAR